MTKTERITRNAAIVRLAKRAVPVLKIAEAYGLSHQMVYNIINRAKDEESAKRELARIRKEETKKWIERTVQNNKRTHVRLTDVVKGICAQILRLYEGEEYISQEDVDYDNACFDVDMRDFKEAADAWDARTSKEDQDWFINNRH